MVTLDTGLLSGLLIAAIGNVIQVARVSTRVAALEGKFEMLVKHMNGSLQ